MSLRRPNWTVRTRIVTAVVVLTVLTLAIVGVTSYLVEKRSIQDRVDEQIGVKTEQFSTLVTQEYDSGAYDSMDALLRDTLGHTVPTENEGSVGFAAGRAAWTQPGGLEMTDDPELMKLVSERVAATTGTDGEISTLETGESLYRYGLLPLQLGTLGDGAYVVAFDLNAEFEDLQDTMRVFIIASLLCLVILTFFAWLIAGELLSPVRQLESTAKQISRSDLSSRLDIDTNDDLARVAHTFNDMLDRLQSAFDSQMQLLDDAGHELRTPITIMRGHLELMDSTDPGEVNQVRDLAVDELDRMHRLADDLVMLAKAKRPDFVTTHPVDVGPLLVKVAELGRALGPHEVVIADSLEMIAPLDEQRITQAMLQLIGNAMKFSDDQTTIAIGARVTPTDLELWVRDEGVGIAPEDQERIFERFGRVDSRVEGTGLGLTIVAEIASGHQGRVELHSEPGIGSTFTIIVPLEETWPTS